MGAVGVGVKYGGVNEVRLKVKKEMRMRVTVTVAEREGGVDRDTHTTAAERSEMKGDGVTEMRYDPC